MTEQAVFAVRVDGSRRRYADFHSRETDEERRSRTFHANLAARITKAASMQTYAIVRLLVDRNRVADAYRAYAYFRWMDDRLDLGSLSRPERLAFVERQRALVHRCYRGERPSNLDVHEQLLSDLIRCGTVGDRGLHRYIHSMMAVMAFDAGRKGGLISETELAEYTHWLAVAVTEALHTFIGHDGYSPRGETRYQAATAAHITHMLRDTWQDNAAGYFNVPGEFLSSAGIKPTDVDSDAYRAWVQHRVALAREQFAVGKRYLRRVESLRCRIAGFAYIGRFERVLDVIERDGFLLRPDYENIKTFLSALKLTRRAVVSALRQTGREIETYPMPAIQ